MAEHWFRSALMVVALAPLAYYLLALYCSWEYFRATRSKQNGNTLPRFEPPVSILKPVRGVDRDAYLNFASFCSLPYPQYELLFAVSDPDDPVLAVIEKLRRDFPATAIGLVTDVPQLGANRKVNNLAALAGAARYDLLVVCDSDVRVPPGYLHAVTAPFATAEVGGVTAFFRSRTDGGLAADLEALVIATETVPNALVARRIEGRVKFAFGWTMATTKKHLAEIGGFASMVNHHSDDFELGNRLAARGFRIELMDEPVEMVYPQETLGEFFKHELRWAIGLRNVRPLGYWGLLLTFGLPWTILAMLAAPAGWIAAAYLAAYLALRFVLVWTVGVRGLEDEVARRRWWLVPLRDLFNFAVWVAGFFTNRIRWRGVSYRVKKGLLIPAEASRE